VNGGVSVCLSGLSEGVRSLVARSHHRRHFRRLSADHCTGQLSLRRTLKRKTRNAGRNGMGGGHGSVK